MTSVSLKGARVLRLSMHDSALRWPRRRVLAAGTVRSRDVSRGTWEHATRLSSSVSEVVPIGLESCHSVHSSGVRPRGPSWPDHPGRAGTVFNVSRGTWVAVCSCVAATRWRRRVDLDAYSARAQAGLRSRSHPSGALVPPRVFHVKQRPCMTDRVWVRTGCVMLRRYRSPTVGSHR